MQHFVIWILKQYSSTLELYILKLSYQFWFLNHPSYIHLIKTYVTFTQTKWTLIQIKNLVWLRKQTSRSVPKFVYYTKNIKWSGTLIIRRNDRNHSLKTIFNWVWMFSIIIAINKSSNNLIRKTAAAEGQGYKVPSAKL